MDPFSIDEPRERQQAAGTSEQDLMCFSFDHVLKNYNRQQKTSSQLQRAQPHSPVPSASSQYMRPFPLSNENRTMPASRITTLPAQSSKAGLPLNQFGTQQQQSFPVANTNPFSVPNPATNPFASSWTAKPDNKTLKDLSVFATLPQQSRSSPPSPTPNFFDIDKFLSTPEPVVSKSASSENPFTKVPHGQPLPRSAADELLQMLQDPSPSETEYKHPPSLPPRQASGQGSQQQDQGSLYTQSNNAIQKIAPPTQTIRRISSQPSIGTMEQTKTTQHKNNNCGFNSIRNSNGDIAAPPLPPKMYTNTSAGAQVLPVHPPSDDLIVWSPKQNAGFSFDDNFMEFDPLKAAEKEAAAVAVAAAAAATATEEEEPPPLPPKGSTGESVMARERPASYSNTKEVKVEKLSRPKTVHGQRPRSLEMGREWQVADSRFI